MVAVKPNPGVTGALAELGLTGTGDAGADGDAFTAIMAGLTDGSEGRSADAGTGGVEDAARPMIAMITGVASTGKPGEVAIKSETVAEQASEGETNAEGSTLAAPLPTIAPAVLQPQATPVQAAAAIVPEVAITDRAAAPPAPEVSAAIAASTASITSVETETAATLTQGTANAPVLTAIAAMAPLKPGIEAAARSAIDVPPPAAVDIVNLEANAKSASPAAALQSLLQLGAPALSRAFGFTAKMTPSDRVDPTAATTGTETKPVNASAFLVSTILPLLPESLHATVLGQSAPIEAATASAPTAPPLDAAHEMIEQQLDLAHEGEWLDQLAKDIARSAGKEGGLRFRLNPANLGSLHVEMTQGPAGASIRMTTDTEAARAIIADAQPKLVAEARANGVRIAESHVDLGGSGQQAAGDPRRQADLDQQRFVRTAAAGEAEAPETSRPAAKAAERYA